MQILYVSELAPSSTSAAPTVDLVLAVEIRESVLRSQVNATLFGTCGVASPPKTLTTYNALLTSITTLTYTACPYVDCGGIRHICRQEPRQRRLVPPNELVRAPYLTFNFQYLKYKVN